MEPGAYFACDRQPDRFAAAGLLWGDGDLKVDSHHTAEDVAILLGRAFDRALGDRRGIVRIAHAYAPLDEALALAVIDISGRGHAQVDAGLSDPRLGDLDSDMVQHMLESFAVDASDRSDTSFT